MGLRARPFLIAVLVLVTAAVVWVAAPPYAWCHIQGGHIEVELGPGKVKNCVIPVE